MKCLNDKKSAYIKYGVLYFIVFVFSFLTICLKQNFHIDETATFGLSNNSSGTTIQIESGKTFYDSKEPFVDFFAVERGESFHYDIVWENQKNDVHPPLYYSIIHTICSITPEFFSKWQAGLVNIVFALLAFVAFQKLIRKLIPDINYYEICVVSLVAIYPIVNSVAFLRMYMMAMCIVLFITDVFLSIYEKNEERNYIFLLVISISAALTHYYCLMYLVFCCISFSIGLILKWNYSTFGKIVVVETFSAGISISIFPSMINHMFSGYRGSESIDNLANTNLNDYLMRIKSFYSFLNQILFGKLFLIIVALIIGISIYALIIKKTASKQETIAVISKYLILLLPVIMYFLFVSKAAVYVSDRYFMPIYLVTYLIVISSFMLVLHKVKNIIIEYVTITLLAIGILIGQWNVSNPYLYRDSVKLLNDVEQFDCLDAVVLCDSKSWKLQNAYYEISKFKSVTFLPKEEVWKINEIETLKKDSELIVMIVDDDEITRNAIMMYLPQLNAYEKIGKFSYTTTYHFYYDSSQENKDLGNNDKQIRYCYLTTVNNDRNVSVNFENSDLIVDSSEGLQFILCLCEDDTYKIIYRNRVFDIVGGLIQKGTSVWLHNDNGTIAQRWRIGEINSRVVLLSEDKKFALGLSEEGKISLCDIDDLDNLLYCQFE